MSTDTITGLECSRCHHRHFHLVEVYADTDLTHITAYCAKCGQAIDYDYGIERIQRTVRRPLRKRSYPRRRAS